MNRRWLVALVIVMLAALAPSAALAAPAPKPGDAISTITWTSDGGVMDDNAVLRCLGYISVTTSVAKGPQRSLYYGFKFGDGTQSLLGPVAVPRDGSLTGRIYLASLEPAAYANMAVRVYVELRDKKGPIPGASALTTGYTFDTDWCPDPGTPLGTKAQ